MSSEKFLPAPMSKRQEDAAMLVAADELDDATIANRAGITDRQLRKWKQQPDFAARVAEHRELWRVEIETRGIANRTKRVEALNDRWARMQRVIDARAEEYKDGEIAGGETGLLVRQTKMVGTGRDAELVAEYAVDVGLLREMRAHEEQAAKELGQWIDKAEHKHDHIVREYVGVDINQVVGRGSGSSAE